MNEKLDWSKPIQYRNGEPCHLLETYPEGSPNFPDRTRMIQRDGVEGMTAIWWFKEDGKGPRLYKNGEYDIINVPQTDLATKGMLSPQEPVRGWRARALKAESALASLADELRRTKVDLKCAQENFHVTNQAYVKADEELRLAREDAARWQHSVQHGFPVLNQTAHTTAVRWIAHRPDGIEYGESAAEATDAAIDAAASGPKEPR